MKMKQPHSAGQQQSSMQTITRAVTHIRLQEVNTGKLVALDAVADAYLALCQQYVTLFCTEETPNKFRATGFATLLSEQWHRVAIQQAAGIAQAWRSNRATAYHAHLEAMADFQERQVSTDSDTHSNEKAPEWKEWNIPVLKQQCIQANVNVVALEPSQDSTFEYWLKVSTLEKGHPMRLPVKLADYHRAALEGKMLNTSVTLNKRDDTWWLAVTYDEQITVQTEATAPVVGVDVGIANFLTTSDGKHYGTFHGKLRERQKRDREKRRRKAKLRACLQKKDVEKLPSTSSKSSQRLRRHVRQEINRAVNECVTEHAEAHIAYEQLSVATMRFKARTMNAYLSASSLAHIPEQLAWVTAKRGISATTVRSAYSSQECSVCHYTDRKNRPNQQTFCCQVCGNTLHADVNAAINLAQRWHDTELQTCKNRQETKALLLKRHAIWLAQNR